MKRSIIFLLVLLMGTMAFGYDLDTTFQVSYYDGNLPDPDWFGPNDFRGLTYHDGTLYLCDGFGIGLAKINPETGAITGVVGDTTNSSRIRLGDVETDSNGKLFGSKMAGFAWDDTVFVYTWSDDGPGATRDTVLSWAPDQEKWRMGDDFTVVGSYADSTMEIYMANSLNDAPSCNQIFKWDMEKSGFGLNDAPDDTIVVQNIANGLGLQVDVWPIGGVDAEQVMLAGNGLQTLKVNVADGSWVGVNPGNIQGYQLGNGISQFVTEGRKFYVQNAQWSQNAQIIEYTDGLLNVNSILATTDPLGPHSAADTPRNADFIPHNSDNDIVINEDGTVDIFVLQADNGYARYNFEVPTQTPVNKLDENFADWAEFGGHDWNGTNVTLRSDGYGHGDDYYIGPSNETLNNPITILTPRLVSDTTMQLSFYYSEYSGGDDSWTMDVVLSEDGETWCDTLGSYDAPGDFDWHKAMHSIEKTGEFYVGFVVSGDVSGGMFLDDVKFDVPPANAVDIALNPSILNFGQVQLFNHKTMNFEIINTGSGQFTVNSSSTTSDEYSVDLPDETIMGGDTLQGSVTFLPYQAGDFSDDLVISTSVADTVIKLNATGVTGGSPLTYQLSTDYELSHVNENMGWFDQLFDDFNMAGIEYTDGLLLLPGSSNGSQIWRVNKEVRLTPDLIIGQAPEAGNEAFNLWDAESDEDGRIFASQLATSENSDTLRIWTYTQPYDKKAEDELVLSWAPNTDNISAYRLGTKFGVTGSYEDGTMEIYIPNALDQSGCNQVFKWDLKQSEFSALDAPDDTIEVDVDYLGLQTDVWPLGVGAREIVLAGKTLPVMKVKVSDGSIVNQADPDNSDLGYATGVSHAYTRSREMLFLNNIEGQNVQVVDITDCSDWANITNEHILFETDSLGSPDSNAVKSGDNDIEVNEDGSIDLYTVHTDNGYAHYRIERKTAEPEDIVVEPDSLNFGQVELFSNKTMHFNIINNGENYFAITSTSTSSEQFKGAVPKDTLFAEDTLKAAATFLPYESGSYAGELVISTNIEDITIKLSGSGYAGGPPLSYQLTTDYEISYTKGTMDWFGTPDFGDIYSSAEISGIEYVPEGKGLLFLAGHEGASMVWRVNNEVKNGAYWGLPDLIVGQDDPENTAYHFWDVESDADGKLFAVHRDTLDEQDTVKVWAYDAYDKMAKEELILTWSPDPAEYPDQRIGTKLAVVGSHADGTMEIYMTNSMDKSGCNQIFKWDMKQSEIGENDAPDEVIEVGVDYLGLQTDIWPVGGVGAREFILSGKTLPVTKVKNDGSIITQADPENSPLGYGTGVSHAFVKGKDLLFLNNIENQNVQVINITDCSNWANLTADDVLFETETLGSPDSNLVKSSDNDIEVNEDGTIDLYALQTDNGYGHYLLEEAMEPMSIAEAKVDADGDYRPDLLGETVQISGIVTTPNFGGSSYTEYFMQDDSAGICIFKYGETLDLSSGDMIKLTGTIAQFNGKTEIEPDTIELIRGGMDLPEPIKYFEIREEDPEKYEGMLIKIDSARFTSDEWPAENDNMNINLWKNISETEKDTMLMRIDKDTDLDGWADHPGIDKKFTVVGILDQFDDSEPYDQGYRIKPRNQEDIKNITSRTDLNDDHLPDHFALHENYPNPFNPTTTIKFDLPKASDVTLQIIDLSGRLVKSVKYENLKAGYHQYNFNAQGLSSGVYFYRMKAEGFQAVKKMALVK